MGHMSDPGLTPAQATVMAGQVEAALHMSEHALTQREKDEAREQARALIERLAAYLAPPSIPTMPDNFHKNDDMEAL